MAENSLSAAQAYDAYLASPEGQMRSEMVWQSLALHLPAPETAANLRALDVGGGVGELATRFSKWGFRTTLLDPSPGMLALARARIAGAAGTIELVEAGVSEASSALAEGFDVVTCHFVIEYVEDPHAAIHALAALASPGALLSIVTRNAAGEVLKHASEGAWEKARAATGARSFEAKILGEKGALLGRDLVQRWLRDAGVEPVAERGLRVLTAAPPSDPSEVRERIAFELELGARSPFREIARYTHFIGRKPSLH